VATILTWNVKPFGDTKTVKDCVSSGQYTPFISPD